MVSALCLGTTALNMGPNPMRFNDLFGLFLKYPGD